jgi:hypothetical protein
MLSALAAWYAAMRASVAATSVRWHRLNTAGARALQQLCRPAKRGATALAAAPAARRRRCRGAPISSTCSR